MLYIKAMNFLQKKKKLDIVRSNPPALFIQLNNLTKMLQPHQDWLATNSQKLAQLMWHIDLA
jgi:hypothetical protein